jgi:regulation of enolase protein 1 (concanavalin A-like superfamily)
MILGRALSGEVSVILTRRWPVQIFVCLCAIVGVASSASAQLPAPWTNRDIGSPAVAGSAAESSGTFTVRGAGSDIWYSSDQFQFVYQTVTGDVDVRAQVNAVQYIDQWTKAGVMIRETLGSTSRHASTFVTPGKGLAFQRRISTGANSVHTAGAFATAPYWVRIVRAGQLFTSYVSPDGASWQLVGSETITMGASVQVGLAVTSHNASSSAMATFTNVTVGTVASAPSTSAWANRDIGSPALAGRSSESSGSFSVTGAGVDIWGSSDQFQFMYQPADGDVEIVARLNNLGYADQWSKAGVMIRQSLSASAAHAFMAGTPGKGWAFQRRPVSGGISVHSPGSFSAPPGWVRLVRSGNEFSAYESTDGTNWEIVGTETISMSSSVYVGLAVTSHNAGLTTTASFTNVTLKKPASSSSGGAPTVTLLAPANGSTFPAPGSITFSATASDSDGRVTKVGFYANGDIVATDTSAPYSRTWGPVPAGTYNVYALATDDTGATSKSATVTITVGGTSTNTPPTSVISSPANGATFTAPANITIAASATDSNGSVTKVEFYRGSTLIGTDTSAPYSATWSNVAAGTYSLTAVAYDNAGASTASAAVSVNVTTATTVTPTTVLFTPSLDHATSVTSYAVAIRRSTDSTSATPVATKNLGKPTPVNNTISVDISDIVNPLAAGSYYAVVTATGSGGSAASAPSATFTK